MQRVPGEINGRLVEGPVVFALAPLTSMYRLRTRLAPFRAAVGDEPRFEGTHSYKLQSIAYRFV